MLKARHKTLFYKAASFRVLNLVLHFPSQLSNQDITGEQQKLSSTKLAGQIKTYD